MCQALVIGTEVPLTELAEVVGCDPHRLTHELVRLGIFGTKEITDDVPTIEAVCAETVAATLWGTLEDLK